MIEMIQSSDYGQFESKRTELWHCPSPRFNALLSLSGLACNKFEMLAPDNCVGIFSQF